jgi:hypothetical protein
VRDEHHCPEKQRCGPSVEVDDIEVPVGDEQQQRERREQ